MDFEIRFLSFYVIQVEGKDEQANKQFKHFQTLDTGEFEESELKDFLDGELKKIVKRKADRHPQSEQVPTKIGHFIVEPATSSILTQTTTCSTARVWRKQKKTSMS